VTEIIKVVVVSTLLLVAAVLVFGRVRRDYQTSGKLTPFATFLEVLIFFLHGSASYAFLDSNLSHINKASPLFSLSILCMLIGVVLVAIAMGRLGMGESVGQQVTGLRQSGLYRYSRNPQIVAYGLVVIGYALLWPSWSGPGLDRRVCCHRPSDGAYRGGASAPGLRRSVRALLREDAQVPGLAGVAIAVPGGRSRASSLIVE
jgi:protein-S-isoprenylcysteine O-methyltransferase Ste14